MEVENNEINNGDLFYRISKRTIDIVASIIGIVLLIPVTIIVFTINKLKKQDTKLFFVQNRIGKNGKLFKMYKFQTMINNADEELKLYLEKNPEAKKEYKKHKKLKDDPRVTEIGKILRKTSLDEFPQFINILKGEMSLVGPRPYLPREIKDMGEFYEYIIKSKPGITGPWQISGRSNISFNERLEIDYSYINSSNDFKSDINIVFKTILIALKGHGAL
jgi:undecaprenyl-phosphate galactose phosphotransferase